LSGKTSGLFLNAAMFNHSVSVFRTYLCLVHCHSLHVRPVRPSGLVSCQT
jgi:hypothetical protein